MKVKFQEPGWVDISAETQEEADEIRVLRLQLMELGNKYGISFFPMIASGPTPECVGVSIFPTPC